MKCYLILFIVGCVGCGTEMKTPEPSKPKPDYKSFATDEKIFVWIEGLENITSKDSIFNASLNACVTNDLALDRCGRRDTGGHLQDDIRISNESTDEDDRGKVVKCTDDADFSVEREIYISNCSVPLVDALPGEEFIIEVNGVSGTIQMPKTEKFNLKAPPIGAFVALDTSMPLILKWDGSTEKADIRWRIENRTFDGGKCEQAHWDDAHGEGEVDDGYYEVTVNEFPPDTDLPPYPGCDAVVIGSRVRNGSTLQGISSELSGRQTMQVPITVSPTLNP